MSWARYDDELCTNRKVIRLRAHGERGIAALGLHLLANAYCRHNGTAGVVEAHVPEVLCGRAGPKLAALLVEVAMFDVRDDGGWVIHDYADYHDPTDPDPDRSAADRKKEISEKRREAGRKGGQANGKQKPSGAVDLLEAKPKDCRSPDPIPSHPITTESSITTHHHQHGSPDDDDGRFAIVLDRLVDERIAKFPAKSNRLAYRTKVTESIVSEHADTIRSALASRPEVDAEVVAQLLGREIA